MDARVVKRLCNALVQPDATSDGAVEPNLTNYYYTSGIFTSSQQALISRIALHGIADVPFLLAEHIQRDNMQAFFLHTAPVAEFVRQYTL